MTRQTEMFAAPSDRLQRRTFLQVGALAASGFAWPSVSCLEAAVDAQARRKSVIMIYLPGGASHIDMYDLKPDAPVEYRGEFDPIDTTVPGLQVCELMPEHAKIETDATENAQHVKIDMFDTCRTGRTRATSSYNGRSTAAAPSDPSPPRVRNPT